MYFVVVIFFFSIFLASYSKIPERHFFDSSANQNCFYSLIFREIFTVSNDLNPSLFLFTTQKKNVIVVFSIFISKLLDQQRTILGATAASKRIVQMIIIIETTLSPTPDA